MDAQVAIPLPEPKGFMSADRYKIQFTFDGEPLLCRLHAKPFSCLSHPYAQVENAAVAPQHPCLQSLGPAHAQSGGLWAADIESHHSKHIAFI